MPKRIFPTRITRLGLPEKTGRIIVAVTPDEKASIREEASQRTETVSAYLLGLHREAKQAASRRRLSRGVRALRRETERAELRRQLSRLAKPKKGGRK